jgi:Ca2+/H+ antiporter
MDHHEQHHLHHQQEREQKKKEHKAHEHQQEKSRLPIHPAWLFAIGLALTVIAVLVWTLVLS